MENKLSIMLVTSEYRGDHAADIALAYEYKEDETLIQLVERVGLKKVEDRIEIRLIKIKDEK